MLISSKKNFVGARQEEGLFKKRRAGEFRWEILSWIMPKNPLMVRMELVSQLDHVPIFHLGFQCAHFLVHGDHQLAFCHKPD